MSDGESEPTAQSVEPAANADSTPFIEKDDRETGMPMGHARVPFYIATAWVAFIIAYVVVMSLVALPDLRAWLRHG